MEQMQDDFPSNLGRWVLFMLAQQCTAGPALLQLYETPSHPFHDHAMQVVLLQDWTPPVSSCDCLSICLKVHILAVVLFAYISDVEARLHDPVLCLGHSGCRAGSQMAEISRVLRPGGVYVASTFMTIDSPLGQIFGDNNIRPLSQVFCALVVSPCYLASVCYKSAVIGVAAPAYFHFTAQSPRGSSATALQQDLFSHPCIYGPFVILRLTKVCDYAIFQ